MRDKTKDIELNETRLRWLHDQLAGRFGPQCVSLGDAELHRHAADLSATVPCPPDLVVYPEEAYQVSWLLEHISDGVKVLPWGRGTSAEGQAVPCGGPATASLDLHRMRRILEYSRADRTVRVEAGLDLAALNAVLQADGLWFPVDPMCNATIGGLLAENAVGLSVARYGRLIEHVLALRVVLADGRTISIRDQDFLKGLFIGNQGLLGVIVEATLKLRPLPHDLTTVWAAFSRLEDAALAVPAVLDGQRGLVRCVLLSGIAVRAINRAHGMQLAECPALLLQIQDGHEPVLAGRPEVIKLEKSSDVDALMIWDRLGAAWLAGAEPVPVSVRLAPTRLAELVREVHQDGHEDCCLLANGAAGTVTLVKPAGEVTPFCETLFPAVGQLGGSLAGYALAPAQAAWAREELAEVRPLLEMVKHALDPQAVLGDL